MESGLERFDPRIAAWFAERYGAPTEIQRLAWPRIARGEHLLVSAPTGSGKTLTGFLWALGQLATGAWETGHGIRVLYVSPLKALNADIERNLADPLAGIAAAFAASGSELPPIRVGVRSGDTPPAERQRLLRRPPEILITTPESLNLLLLSKSAPSLFAGLRTVIVDEIHAVAGNKRGAHLVTAVDRLVPLAGEFQRLGISATVRPLERVAAWLGGHELRRGADGEASFRERDVGVVRASGGKRYDVEVRMPPAIAAVEPEERQGDALWRLVAAALARRIESARSTIVFTNSRRLAEKLTRLVNEESGRELAWSHHGSLARELRAAIEARLKSGALPAIVATSSLELGIDIGALDQVLLVQSPRSLASAAQRIGRAGHGVGEVSRARIYPTHARDLLECAVVARAVVEGEIEPVEPVEGPLDLLAQWILAVTAPEAWNLDRLYDFARASAPFHALPRRQFDLVVEMLAGRYEEARIPELRARLAVDRLAGEARARPGTARLLAQAGGTIPDRGYFQLRVEESNARLGDLDEEFVWERALGDTFLLGTQSWRIRRITANEVFVSPARGGIALAPFWRADGRSRGAVFSDRIAALLERLDSRLDEPGLADELAREERLDAVAAAELVKQLREARALLGGELPHRRRIVFEEVLERAGEERSRTVLLYTFWGGTSNRALAMALAAVAERSERLAIETFADDDAVLLRLPDGVDARALLLAVRPDDLEELLRLRLEGSGLFGAQFRQNAQRALLLPRKSPGRRTPLWQSRENAKRLLEAVERFDDFPVTLESWRSTLREELDLPALRAKLAEVEAGTIRIGSVRSERPSPFAAGLVWRRTNDLMYEDDVPAARRPASLRSDLVREVALGERPAFEPELVDRYRRKVQRLLPGYPPQSASELLEWVKERLLVPADDWRELLGAIDRDRPDAAAELETELVRAGRLAATDGAGRVATESRSRLDRASAERFEEWLRFEAPAPRSVVAARWGVPVEAFDRLIEPLVAAERVVVGRIVAGGAAPREPDVASLAAVETLLHWRRAGARPELAPLPLARLPLFLAEWQGLVDRASGPDALRSTLEKLFALPAPAALWESDLLPARLDPYRPAELDLLFDESPLRWVGAGRERVTFAFASDLDLVAGDAGGEGGSEGPASADPELDRALRALLAAAPRGLDLEELLERTQRPSSELLPALWSLAWRGSVAGDSMRSLRQGIDAAFAGVDLGRLARANAAAGPSRSAGRRALRRAWQGERIGGGRFFAVEAAPELADPLVATEAARELARLALDRYGVVFRELLQGEGAISWSRIARPLRALELSGEIVAGSFFEGVPGLQFATPRAVERLRELGEGRGSAALWWANAVDPASPCGLPLEALRGEFPRRVASNTLVFRGERLVAVYRRGGAETEFRLPPDDPGLAEATAPLAVALTRAVRAERFVDVETIQGEAAATSPYRRAFAAFEATAAGSGVLRLRRRYTTSGAESAPPVRTVPPATDAPLGRLPRERNDTR